MFRSTKFLPALLLASLALIWGSSFILMKYGLRVYSADQVACMRMSLAFICLLPLTFKHITKVPRKYWGWILVAGLTGNGIPSILFATAQTKLSSSVAGVLNSLTPIFVLIIAAIVFKQKFSSAKIFGLILGLAGAVILILVRANGSLDPNYTYGLYIVVAAICYAISVNVIKTYLHELSSLAISGLALVGIGPPCAYYLLAHTNFLQIWIATPENTTAFGYIFLLAAFGTAVSLILFNKLVQLTNVVYASSVTYLIPIVALLWGVIDGEAMGAVHLLGMAAILGGVYLANKKEKPSLQATVPPKVA